jgi:hypothetical protein
MKKMLFNLLLALPVLVLVACGGPSATTESPPAEVPQEAAEPAQEQEAAPAATSPLEPTLAPRSATLQSAEGTIQIRTNAGGGILAVEPGMALVAGNEIQTGPDGEAVLLLDDGTVIVVAENSTFTQEPPTRWKPPPESPPFAALRWVSRSPLSLDRQ